MKNHVDLEYDKSHIWHPYTSTLNPLRCYPVVGAEGVRLKLQDGRELIDGMSSWWAAVHGYNHPTLNQAVKEQLAKMAHVMFGGLTHEPAIELCRRLVALTPEPLTKVFLSDSGSISVEVALKMALQYWRTQGQQRNKVIAIRNGYHGDSFGAMMVTDPQLAMHELYEGFLPEQIFAESTSCGYRDVWNGHDTKDLEEKLSLHEQDVAAVIIEPIVQGAGGMRIYNPGFLRRIRELCDESGVLLIADEIATGFGRTGKMFACEHADITPDIMCLGKTLTGGYLTLAATLTTAHIADTICNGEANCFMHGPTFMGNPLACSVASASIDLLIETKWAENVKRIESIFASRLLSIVDLKSVKEVRWIGAIGVVELHSPVAIDEIQKRFVDQGVWIRPFGRLIYVMPPYIISNEDLIAIIDAIKNVLR